MTADELKQFCKDRGLTYAQLAERIGMSEGGLRSNISKGAISEQTAQSIKLLERIYELESEVSELHTLKTILKNLVK